jgi:hypothetical protein
MNLTSTSLICPNRGDQLPYCIANVSISLPFTEQDNQVGCLLLQENSVIFRAFKGLRRLGIRYWGVTTIIG